VWWRNGIEFFRLRVLNVGGVRVGVFRLGDELHADRCPHRGAPLCGCRVGTHVLIEADGGRGERRALSVAQV
jgi:hypothetical protein